MLKKFSHCFCLHWPFMVNMSTSDALLCGTNGETGLVVQRHCVLARFDSFVRKSSLWFCIEMCRTKSKQSIHEVCTTSHGTCAATKFKLIKSLALWNNSLPYVYYRIADSMYSSLKQPLSTDAFRDNSKLHRRIPLCPAKSTRFC